MKIDPSVQRMLYTTQNTAAQRRRSAPAPGEASTPAADTVTLSQEALEAAEQRAAQKAASAAGADMPKEEEAPEEAEKFLSATEAALEKTTSRKLTEKERMAKALQQAQNEYKTLCDQLERAKDSGSGEIEGYKNLAKALKIAALIMRGHRVSAADRQFMAENFPEILEKAEMMKMRNKNPKDYDVTGEEEEESEDSANESGIAESASISGAGIGGGDGAATEGGGETAAG